MLVKPTNMPLRKYVRSLLQLAYFVTIIHSKTELTAPASITEPTKQLSQGDMEPLHNTATGSPEKGWKYVVRAG